MISNGFWEIWVSKLTTPPRCVQAYFQVPQWGNGPGRCIATLRQVTRDAAPSEVISVAALEGGRVVSGSQDCTVKVWTLPDGLARLCC